MSVLGAYRAAGCRTHEQVLALASTRGPAALAEARVSLRENSEGNIQRLLKTSPQAARMFQKLFGPVAFAAAKACVLVKGAKAPVLFSSHDEKKLDFAIWDSLADLDGMARFITDNGTDTESCAREFTGFLQKFDVAKKVLAANSINDLKPLFQSYRNRIELANKKAAVQLSGGWKWIDLDCSSSELERDQMGHCGHDDRGNLYSLRDRNGNPHVTLTMDDKGIIHQIKGKGNSTPDRKFWPAIKQFMDQMNAELYMHSTISNVDDAFARPDGVPPELDRFLYGEPELKDESRLREAGRQNSTAMVVVPGSPPGRNICGLVRSLAKDRSRLIVVAQRGGTAPGSFERMLRASIPDCEKRVRVIEADGRLVDMVTAAVQNRHYSPKQSLEIFCDSQLAQQYSHDSTDPSLPFDPGLIVTHPTKVPMDDAKAIDSAVRGQDSAAQHRVLDAHIFSSPDGMAEFRDALLGNPRQANEDFTCLAGMVITEFLADISPSKEIAIAKLRDLLAAEIDDIEGLQYLGSGRNGSAYRSPDGFVLKVTTDEAEAESALRLIGQATEHLGRVFEVRPLAEGVWLLTQEDLEALPDDLREEFDLAMEVLTNLDAMDSLNAGELREVVHILSKAESRAARQIQMAIDVMRRFNVAGMCEELNALGLSGDFHSGNVMLRNGSPVLIDLGTPGESPIFQIEVHHPIGRRINEFGTGAPGSGASGPATMRGSNSSSWSNGRGALKSPANHVPEDENADEEDYALDWGPGRVSGASF